MLNLTPNELQAYRENAGMSKTFVLLDVRELWEYQYVHLDNSLLIPLGQLPGQFEQLDRKATIMVLCHHGIRSAYACELLEQQGFDTINIKGGIDLWAREVDTHLALY